MPATRFSWLVPRYSIANLLMLMVVIGIALAWYDQRRKIGEQVDTIAGKESQIAEQQREIKRLTVSSVLRNYFGDDHKAKALSPHVQRGMHRTIIEEWTAPGHSCPVTGAPGNREYSYSCDLIVEYDTSEHVVAFGYLRPSTHIPLFDSMVFVDLTARELLDAP